MSRILVIEDELTLLDATATILSNAGYAVLEASDGLHGLRLARQQLPDLILSDIMMPGLNGYELLESLRHDLATVTIPVIFVTALSTPTAMRQGMSLGADDFLVKPYTVPHLLNAIKTRLARQAALSDGQTASLSALRSSLIRALPVEIRTPLQTILSSATALETGQPSADAVLHSADTILEAGQHLQHLIENYLFYVQTEIMMEDAPAIAALRQQITPDPVPVIEAAAWVQAEQYQRGADLSVAAEPVPLALGEESLAKIVSELVDNALKFSKSGTPVKVTAARQDNRYALSVQDSGCGIHEERVQAIQANAPVEGLGLTIVRRLVELHGGSLHLQSDLARGTLVRLLLPIDIALSIY